ncbi:MAG: hypothetical protein GY826_17475, partial [Fuerstiella sp.]|nr:hypothetical protein [Fuerstiella sp.]
MSDLPPAFDVIPDDSVLDDVPRDLKFHPAARAVPGTLTGRQIESYNTDGFIRPIDVYESDEITEIRTYFDGLLEKTMARGGDSYSISTAHLRHGPVYDMLTYSVLVDCVADLLGDDVIAWGSHFFGQFPSPPISRVRKTWGRLCSNQVRYGKRISVVPGQTA